MELILIDQTKLKIMLTAPDLQHYELAPERLEAMSCTDEHTRNAFRHIFDDAEAQIGFHTSGEKLFVQMFTSKCGGCEIFVTRLGNESLSFSEGSRQGQTPPGDRLDSLSLTPGEEALIRKVLAQEAVTDDTEFREEEAEPMSEYVGESHGARGHEPSVHSGEPPLKRVCVTVTSLETLLAICARLLRVGYTGTSRAYIDHEARPAAFHLCLELPDGIFYTLPEAYAFLKEYGRVTRGKSSELYFGEHGRVLCGDRAVETLGVL